MKFKNLSDEQKNYIAKIHGDKDLSWDERMQILKQYTGLKSERAVRKWTEKLKLTKPTEIASPQYEEAKKKKFDKKKQYHIITWAQNNTPVHPSLLSNIEAYSKEIGASIHVIAGRYRNPTSVFTDRNVDTWSRAVRPYLDANRHDIHKYMSVMADVKIQPTAVNPLSGLQSMSKGNSCIFGHPKMHMEMIPVLEGTKPKMMLTTGAVTVSNYTDSKAGKKGEFNHTLGFVIIEIDDKDIFYVRQVTADDKGNFNDLYHNITDGVITRNKTIDSIIMGDLHYAQHDPRVIDKTFNDLLVELKAKNLVIHDALDAQSITYHDEKNPFIQYQKEMDGTNSIGKEMNELKGFFDYIKPFGFNIVVTRANHDDMVDRWLVGTDWRRTTTPKNSLEYMEYATAILKGNAPKGILPWILETHDPSLTCLGVNGSFKSKGWELGQHGHLGSNGSRGSIMQYDKLNTKVVTGHSHTPGRKNGAIAVGTSTVMRVGYNTGPSSWLQSHVIIHEDGKAQHINFIKNEKDELNFTTFK